MVAMSKKRDVGCLFLVLALAASTQAQEPSAPNPQTLGLIEGVLDKCAELDPAHAADYHAQVKMISQDASEKVISEIRKSEAYLQAYEAAVESIAAIDAKDAKKKCMNSIGSVH
jgi:hypothetical protein